MLKPSIIHPDVELRDLLQGNIVVGQAGGGTALVKVYCNAEAPTSSLPNDFICIQQNGSASTLGTNIQFASGYLMLILYSKMNDDGSAKMNRINNILTQFDELLEGANTANYFYRFDSDRIIMPTTTDQSSGYSTTILNLRWTTNINFSKS